MSENAMKAVIYNEYGGPEVLHIADVPMPRIGPGEALVKVRAVALNGFDLMARSGRYRPNESFPHILGGDVSGVVEEIDTATGADVTVGTRVTAWWVVPCGICEQCITGHPNRCSLNYRYLGAHLPGAYAQYVKLPALNVIPIPDNLSFEEAAAFPHAFGTAWHMLVNRARVRAGEQVLVNSASAGVSMAAIQICKLAGAYVYTTSSTDWKLDKARELGADEVINYNEADFREEIMRRTGKRGVDLVVEHVGGSFLDRSIRCLTRGGRLVTTGGTAS